MHPRDNLIKYSHITRTGRSARLRRMSIDRLRTWWSLSRSPGSAGRQSALGAAGSGRRSPERAQCHSLAGGQTQLENNNKYYHYHQSTPIPVYTYTTVYTYTSLHIHQSTPLPQPTPIPQPTPGSTSIP